MAEFLRLVADNAALQQDLIGIAAKHDFAFTTGELSDADLDRVTGGRGGTTIVIIDPNLNAARQGGTGKAEP